MIEIGQYIDNKYKVLELLGKGGMSEVYLAINKHLNKQWAIKVIKKQNDNKKQKSIGNDPVSEANLIKSLDHPYIVRIVDIIENDDEIYIIEDYIEGEPLSAILERQGAQPQELVIEWALQICDALRYLHSRTPAIIYRDMKPGNVMLKPDGTIKLIDFGIAREYKDKGKAVEDTVHLGTKGYAAPEQYGGSGQSDERTDIYCLGVTLYHLVTGKSPWVEPYEMYPIRYWNPQLSAGLEAIILRCTQLNPNDRYQNCEELIYALQHYEAYGKAYREKQKRKLHTFIASGSAALIALSIGIGGIVMRNMTNNADYSQNMVQAEQASDIAQKISYYEKAIDIKPTAEDAYLGMIEAFKSDASFSAEAEEPILQRKVNEYQNSLRKERFYPQLAFEIGKLYWYYYDYDKSEANAGLSDEERAKLSLNNQITRITSARSWFSDAVEFGSEESDFYLMANAYKNIGEFHNEITLRVEEASDHGIYADYWQNINQLIDLITASENSDEMIELEVYKLSMYSIENYARKFKSDGITQADMQTQFDKIKSGIAQVEATSDKTKNLKNYLLSAQRIEETQASINHAYREVVTE